MSDKDKIIDGHMHRLAVGSVYLTMASKNKSKSATTLSTFEEIDAAWSSNYDTNGRIKNLALSGRIAARERELAISMLGWTPEDGTPGNRYAATGSELRRWALETVSK